MYFIYELTNVNFIMLNKLTIFSVFLMTCLLTACHEEDVFTPYLTDTPSIRIVYSINGLGDLSYNDNIHYGIWQAKVKHGEDKLNMEVCSPSNMQMAEDVIGDWFNDRFSSRQLLILGSPAYASLLEKHPEWKATNGADVFIIDSNRQDIDIYSWYLSLNGISHLTGQLLKTSGIDKVAMVIANNQEYLLQESARGFIDGFTSAGGNISDDDIYYLSDMPEQGFSIPDSLYHLCYTLDQKGYDFVIPVAGGSAQGVYRYTRQNTPINPKGMFYTCGIDVDMQDYSDHVGFSIVKRSDKLVYEFIDGWVTGKPLQKSRTLGLDSEYVELKIADRYSGTPFDPIVIDSLKSISIEYENKRLTNK